MKNKIFKYLDKVKSGYLKIITPCNSIIEVGDKNSAIKADINIKDWHLLDLVIARGDIGFGEAYINGSFTTHKIEDLLSFITLNYQELEPLFHSNIINSTLFKFKKLLRKNTLKGSKKNIEFHYDLGNDFYELWLDKTMSYSSAIFDKDSSLINSQLNKYNKIITELAKGETILEIGCGWGGFIKAAEAKGFITKGLTLSKEQKSYTDNLIKQYKLKSYTALQDYRFEENKYDNIVSIEMFEAVGQKYWQKYFSQIKKCLKNQGSAVIQTITIHNDQYKKYFKTSDFIREYIFPGGFLPTNEIFKEIAAKNGLIVANEYSFAASYHKTLLEWLKKFNQMEEKVKNLGYNQEFIRKWQFYLAYCAAGFKTERTNVTQFTLKHG